MSSTDSIHTLVQESTATAFESAAFAQRQQAEFLKTWLGTLESRQTTARELTLKALTQVQEAQKLWVELLQESLRSGVDNAVNLSQTGLKEATEGLDKVSRQSKANGKEATPAGK